MQTAIKKELSGEPSFVQTNYIIPEERKVTFPKKNLSEEMKIQEDLCKKCNGKSKNSFLNHVPLACVECGKRSDLPSELYGQALPVDYTESDWLEKRKKGIGGSDAGAIVGLNPWSSPLIVYLDKLGLLPPIEENEAMRMGKELEPVILKLFEKQMSKELTNLQIFKVDKILRHPDYEFILANLDAVMYCDEYGWGIIEAKTAGERKLPEWEGDSIPDSYMCQIQHYMLVTKFNYTFAAALIGGQRFIIKKVDRDVDLISILLQKEIEFWKEFVQKRIPPAPIGISKEEEAVKNAFSEPSLKSIELPREAIELIGKHEEINSRIKELETEKSTIETSLKILLSESESGSAGGRKVNWTPFTTNRVDNKLLQAKYPDVYREVLKPSTGRRFSIK